MLPAGPDPSLTARSASVPGPEGRFDHNATSRALQAFLTQAPELRQWLNVLMASPALRPNLGAPPLELPSEGRAILHDALLAALRWTLYARQPDMISIRPVIWSPHALDMDRFDQSTWEEIWPLRSQVGELRIAALQTGTLQQGTLEQTEEGRKALEKLLLLVSVPHPPELLRSDFYPLRSALRRLLAAVPLDGLRAQQILDLHPPVGDMRIDNTLVLLTIQRHSRFGGDWRAMMTACLLLAHVHPALAGVDRLLILWPSWRTQIYLTSDELLQSGDAKLAKLQAGTADALLQGSAAIDWAAIGRRQRREVLSEHSRERIHPVLALHVLNAHTKWLGERLDDQSKLLAPSLRVEWRRQQTELYHLKGRAARRLLEDGQLWPTGVDGPWLLVAGRTPLGVKGFHLPREEFGDFEAQIRQGDRVETSTQEARRLHEHFGVSAATNVLIEMLARHAVKAKRKENKR